MRFNFSLDFQDPVTPIMQGIVDLHNHIMFYLIMILIIVLYALISIFISFYKPFAFPRSLSALNLRTSLLEVKNVTHGTVLEVVWTILPSVVLIAIAVPSFSLLYAMDEVIDPRITVKAVGRQWYWHYEFANVDNAGDVRTLNVDSYMLATNDLESGQLRLLDVDNPLLLPAEMHIRLLVTASDVLHSWAVPSLGIKIDCVPGRLNQVSLFINYEGVYYGQCSELCGVNHGFMPIVVKAVSVRDFVGSYIPEPNIEEGPLQQNAALRLVPLCDLPNKK